MSMEFLAVCAFGGLFIGLGELFELAGENGGW